MSSLCCSVKQKQEFQWWTNYYLYIIVATHVVVLGSHLGFRYLSIFLMFFLKKQYFRLPMGNSVHLNPETSSVQLTKDESDIFVRHIFLRLLYIHLFAENSYRCECATMFRNSNFSRLLDSECL